MKAAVYYNNNDVRIEERPVPIIGDGEILVKIMSSGICGSDVLEWYRIKTAPRILGHEMSGVITESRSDKFMVGDRVFVSHHVACDSCGHCRKNHHTACELLHNTNYDPGGFSEFLRIPKINVEKGTFLLPDNMSFDDATFIEPIGCVARGQRIADITQGDKVLVIGSGISGILHIQLSKLNRAAVTAIDINDYRIMSAKKFGADKAINATQELNEKFDKIIVCTGAVQAAETAINHIEKGGTILFFAVPKPGIDVAFPINEFWRNEISIKTSYGAANQDLIEAVNIIRYGKVNIQDMITHKLPLSEAQKGFKLVADAKESIKVILHPN